MNTKEHMIIIKGNVKISEVRACRYNSDTETWEVEFTAGKVYSYSYSNVVHLQNPEQLNPSLYRIRRGGKELYAVREIFVFHGTDHNYWHLCFENGEERNYLEKELEIEESVLKDSQTKDVLAYLKQLSQLSEMRNCFLSGMKPFALWIRVWLCPGIWGLQRRRGRRRKNLSRFFPLAATTVSTRR